jgi:uncharacterized protein YqgV (UPF0045/DUF77 family)
MVFAEFSICPMDKCESVGAYVARALDIVDRSGLACKLGPLGTCLEGEWHEVMAVIPARLGSIAGRGRRAASKRK